MITKNKKAWGKNMETKYMESILNASVNTLNSLGINGSLLDKKENLNIKSTNIEIGIIGDLQGKFILSMNENLGCFLINKMFQGMMIVETIDDMGKSALCELGNMIAGSAATNLSNLGLTVDITTPVLKDREDCMDVKICIPMEIEKEELDTYLIL